MPLNGNQLYRNHQFSTTSVCHALYTYTYIATTISIIGVSQTHTGPAHAGSCKPHTPSRRVRFMGRALPGSSAANGGEGGGAGGTG